MALKLNLPLGKTGIVATIHQVTHYHVYRRDQKTEIGYASYLDTNTKDPIDGTGNLFVVDGVPPDSGVDAWLDARMAELEKFEGATPDVTPVPVIETPEVAAPDDLAIAAAMDAVPEK